MKTYCTATDPPHEVEVKPIPGTMRYPQEVCQVHQIPLKTAGQLKPRKPLARVSPKKAAKAPSPHGTLKRSRRRETAAESRARFHFNEYTRTRPCFLFWQERPGHCCDGPRDMHHLIPKQFIRRRLSDWPERDLLRVLFNPLIGAPLCRAGHEAIEARTEFIYWDELSDECLEFVSSLPDFMLLRLEEESPKRELASPSRAEGERAA